MRSHEVVGFRGLLFVNGDAMGVARRAGLCATIGFGIESNGFNGAENGLRRTHYAGIANLVLFDLALFNLVGERGTLRAERVRPIAGGSGSDHHFARSGRFSDGSR